MTFQLYWLTNVNHKVLDKKTHGHDFVYSPSLILSGSTGGVELVRVVQCPAVFINFWQNWTAKWTGGPLFVVHVYNKMWSVFDRFWYILKHFRSSFTKFNLVLLNQVYLNLRIYPGFSSNDRISVTKISDRVSDLISSRGYQKLASTI